MNSSQGEIADSDDEKVFIQLNDKKLGIVATQQLL